MSKNFSKVDESGQTQHREMDDHSDEDDFVKGTPMPWVDGESEAETDAQEKKVSEEDQRQKNEFDQVVPLLKQIDNLQDRFYEKYHQLIKASVTHAVVCRKNRIHALLLVDKMSKAVESMTDIFQEIYAIVTTMPKAFPIAKDDGTQKAISAYQFGMEVYERLTKLYMSSSHIFESRVKIDGDIKQ